MIHFVQQRNSQSQEASRPRAIDQPVKDLP